MQTSRGRAATSGSGSAPAHEEQIKSFEARRVRRPRLVDWRTIRPAGQGRDVTIFTDWWTASEAEERRRVEEEQLLSGTRFTEPQTTGQTLKRATEARKKAEDEAQIAGRPVKELRLRSTTSGKKNVNDSKSRLEIEPKKSAGI